MLWTTWLALLAPLALLVTGSLPGADADPHRRARWAQVSAGFGLALAVAVAVSVALLGRQVTPTLGMLGAGVGLYVDAISTTIFLLVSFVGMVVVRFSRNYLDGDPRHGTFVQRLCLTIASVQLVVLAGNMAMLLAAWIATSLFLTQLLQFYPTRRGAILAARKKFVVSRLGDLCLLAAALLLFHAFGAFDYATILAAASAHTGTSSASITLASLLIACAALLKSAQFPLHGWILEVMETPTPVSALLHAGIINAGGFLVLRFAELMVLSPSAMQLLAVVGGLTALFGSLVMMTQTSIKVSLAYSTVAQMGFMLLQCGLGAFAGAMLHIVAHSLYKAHAFLSSGSVVDRLRAAWTPGAAKRPRPGRFLLALLLVLGAAFVLSAGFGASFLEKPGVFVLGSVLMMSLTLLVANAIDERLDLRVTLRVAVAACGIGALYFLLQAGADLLFAPNLPTSPAVASPVDVLIALIAVVSFAAVTLLQSQMGALGQTRWGQALYVHLSHGLYVNTAANRLALALWPARSTRVR